MRLRLRDVRAAVREVLIAEEELHQTCDDACECDACGGQIEDEEVEEMTTVATIGIMGYPTPGPFAALHMPPRKRVLRKRGRPTWSGRVN